MQIAIVRAAARDGFAGYWSAGRHWPSEGTRIVEVVDADDDPAPELSGEHLNQNRIGRKSLAALREETILSVNLRYARSLDDARAGKILDAPPAGERSGVKAEDKSGQLPLVAPKPEPEPEDAPKAKRRR